MNKFCVGCPRGFDDDGGLAQCVGCDAGSLNKANNSHQNARAKESSLERIVSLEPCPFCGYPAKQWPLDVYVTCTGCGAQGPHHDTRQTYTAETAITLWNFRTKKGRVRPKPEPKYDEAYFKFVEELDKEG